jgi:nicotinamidase/pyrazinamidase
MTSRRSLLSSLTLLPLVSQITSATPPPTPQAPAPKTAVIVVDIQGDFTEAHKGSLAVPGTDATYLAAVAAATASLKAAGLPIYATQDWHPANHISFFSNHKDRKPFESISLNGRTQVLWPPHCIRKSQGANLLLDRNLFSAVVQKGKDKRYDSYSGFKDDGGSSTRMESLLRKADISHVIVYGVATDYCVRATALDAAAAGFHVTMIKDLSRGVAPDSTTKALADLKSKGVRVVSKLSDAFPPTPATR